MSGIVELELTEWIERLTHKSASLDARLCLFAAAGHIYTLTLL